MSSFHLTELIGIHPGFHSVATMDFHPTELIIAVTEIHATSLKAADRSYMTKLFRLLPNGTIDMSPIATLPEDTTNPIAFHPSGQFLATVAFNPARFKSNVALWKLIPNSTIQPGSRVRVEGLQVALEMNGRTGTVRGASNQELGRWVVELDADGASYASRGTFRPGNLRVMTTVDRDSYFTGHNHWIRSIAFDPTGHFMATGSADNTVRVWQVPTDGRRETCLAILPDHHSWGVNSVAFSSTGRFLAFGSEDKTVKLWCKAPDDDTIWTCVAILSGHTSNVCSVAFHPKLSLLAVGQDNGNVMLWRKQPDDDTKWTCVATLKDHKRGVQSIAFHPDGLFLATGSWDNFVKIYMLTNDKTVAKCVDTLHCYFMVNEIKFHSGGKFMAVVTYTSSFLLYDCSILTQKRTELLGSQGITQLLAQRLSHPDMRLNINSSKVARDITGEVDAANPSLHLALLNSEEAQENKKKQNQSGRGGRISRKKRKINKHYSYRK